MPQPDSMQRETDRTIADSYRQLGLQPAASMREIEGAYWQFARELKGQSAMAPYTKAYEALVNDVRPRRNDAPEAEVSVPPPSAPQDDSLAARPTSKFGWPQR